MTRKKNGILMHFHYFTLYFTGTLPRQTMVLAVKYVNIWPTFNQSLTRTINDLFGALYHSQAHGRNFSDVRRFTFCTASHSRKFQTCRAVWQQSIYYHGPLRWQRKQQAHHTCVAVAYDIEPQKHCLLSFLEVLRGIGASNKVPNLTF